MHLADSVFVSDRNQICDYIEKSKSSSKPAAILIDYNINTEGTQSMISITTLIAGLILDCNKSIETHYVSFVSNRQFPFGALEGGWK